MRKEKPKTKADLEREEVEYKKFLEKNDKEIEAYCTRSCQEYPELGLEPPFTSEERRQIIDFMKTKEQEELVKLFPNFHRLSEEEQISAKLIKKFKLDPKKFSLKREAWPAINEAIGEVLAKKNRSSESVDSALCRFKK